MMDKPNTKPTLLLHACCAPCSTSVYEQLADDFGLTVYWYNPNIFPLAEHDKRLGEIKKLASILKFDLIVDPDSVSDHQQWNNEAMKQLSNEPEGGPRCWICYEFRLKKVFDYASTNNFDYFATTLTVSPYKNAPKIIEIGNKLSNSTCQFLPRDFKKHNGYQRSIELSKKYDLYRQNYCGCEYSLKN